MFPLHLYLSNGSIPEQCFSPFYHAQGLRLKLSLWFHLNHSPINNIVRVINILIKHWNMKYIVDLEISWKCKLIGHWPILYKTSNSPQYIGASFVHFPSFKKLFLVSLSDTHVPQLQLIMQPFSIRITFISVLSCLSSFVWPFSLHVP